jgi:hypothetical protein
VDGKDDRSPEDAERRPHEIGDFLCGDVKFLCGDVKKPTDNMSFFSHISGAGTGARSCVAAGRAGNPARQVAMVRRPNARLAFEAVRTAVGAELKRLFSNVLQEPLPEEMAELSRQLDQPPPEGGQNTDDS